MTTYHGNFVFVWRGDSTHHTLGARASKGHRTDAQVPGAMVRTKDSERCNDVINEDDVGRVAWGVRPGKGSSSAAHSSDQQECRRACS